MGLETAIIGSAALGAGAGVFGQNEAKKAQGKQKKGLQSLTWDYERARLGELEQGLGEQERLLKQSNREELEGGEEAIQRFEGAGSQAIEDQSQRALGGIQSSMSDRGLSGSSVQGNARIGVGRAASRAYMSLGEMVSAQRQNLAARRAAGTARLGQLRAFRAQARNNILGDSLNILAGFQANQQPIVQQPQLGGFGQGLGYLASQKYQQPGTV